MLKHAENMLLGKLYKIGAGTRWISYTELIALWLH